MEFNKEGETPLDDISGLIPKNIKTRADLDNAEAANILGPTIKYTLDPDNCKKAVFDVPFLKHVHKEMFGDVWTWAGEFRTTQTSIGVEANKIYQALLHLLDDLSFWEKSWDFKKIATRLHHELVKIHPFSNGNGRWARLITDIWMIKHGHEAIEWGDDDLMDVSENRTNYINALKAADRRDFAPLKEFLFYLADTL